MTKIKLLLLLLITSNLYAQKYESFDNKWNYSKNALETYNLKGKVKSIKEYSLKPKKLNSETNVYEFVKPEIKDTIAYIKEVFFDRNGNITKIKKNQIIESMFGGTGFYEERRRYNKTGQIKNISFYTEYSDKIKDQKITVIPNSNPKKVIINTSEWKKGLDNYTAERELTYDKNGNVIKEAVLSDSVIGGKGFTEYNYNNTNDLIQQNIFDKNNIKEIQWDYKYDDNSNLIQTTFLRLEDSDSSKKTLQNDDNGNVILIEGEWDSETFKYQYDSFGNWVSRDKFVYKIIKYKIMRVVEYYTEK